MRVVVAQERRMNMDGDRGNPAEALSIDVDPLLHEIIDISDHVTRTKPMPSSSKPTHTFVNGSVPSHLRRRIKRRKGTAAKRVWAQEDRIRAEGRCKSPRAVHRAGLCAQMPTTAVETSEHITAAESLPLSRTEVGVASTSGCEPCPSNVVSSRIARMMEERSKYARAVEFEIEASKVHWSEMDDATSDEDDENGESDVEVFRSLQQKWGDFFWDFWDMEVGEKIAEGRQAEIFNAGWRWGRKDEYVVKVFKEGWALRHLQKQWPLGMLQNRLGGGSAYYTSGNCIIRGALLLKNGRFAFYMKKYWGDLRKLIDVRMQLNGNHLPPFRGYEVMEILFQIAEGMAELHKDKIIQRDLKAANVLICNLTAKPFDSINGFIACDVADYECSVGVVGTGYWRAPEILRAVQTYNIKPHLFNEKSDVYSFAMTCYEVLTGCIPFEDLGARDYDIVIGGQRPKLPRYVYPWMKRLLSRCWHTNPLKRPCFKDIIAHLGTNCEKNILHEN